MKVWINGRLVDKRDARLTVFDHGMLYGDGVFEGIRVYGGKVFQFKAHMNRLLRSAEGIRLEIPYSRDELIDATHETLRANGVVDGYVRMVATRGEGTLGLGPDHCPQPNTYIIADQIALYPEEMYESGLEVIVAGTVRTSASMLNPRLKSCNYLNNIVAKIECLDAGVAEAIMLNERGEVAEATADNVFIVNDGQVVTPPPDADILLGITRGIVIHLCRTMGIDVRERTVRPEELFDADECFLTGTGAEVIAVTKVDGKVVGSGKSGPVTRKLLAAFREFIRSGEEIEYDA